MLADAHISSLGYLWPPRFQWWIHYSKVESVGRGSTIGVRKSRFPAFFSYQSRHPALLYARIPIPSHFLRGFLLNYWNRRCKYKTYLLTIVSFDGHFFVRASVHVYFDNFRSPVFLELGRLMSHYDSTALLLVSGDEANSVNCLRGV